MSASIPKYRQVLETIKTDIVSGRYQPGQKLPSEAALIKRFETSRITVGRALRELQQAGLIERRPGSGTYVGSGPVDEAGLLFGLLFPNVADTEIFGPIRQGMSEAPQASKHALLWGNLTPDPATKSNQTWISANNIFARKWAAFSLPTLSEALRATKPISVSSLLSNGHVYLSVSIDRCFLPYPERSRHDLVGIDHRRAGYMITEHLLKLGCRRIAFLAYSNSASTVAARIAGYREALFVFGAPIDPALVQSLETGDEDEVRHLMELLEPDGVVGANDRTAGRLMHTLMHLNYRIPSDVRIVGIDDVEYAKLLPVPLTTVHQPCREIGTAAVGAMLERIARPDMPVRDILLDSKLVIRESSGAR